MTLNEVKEYLRLDTDAEDEYLNILIILAGEMCENFTRTVMPSPLPESYRLAMLVCIGYFFEQRSGTKEGIPRVFFDLLLPYRKAAF